MSSGLVKAGDPNKALIEAIAMDIGKEVVAYVEYMYPKAIEATSSTFKLSLRNCIHNEIMAAIAVTDEGQIIARLNENKKHRRQFKAMWKRLRRFEVLNDGPGRWVLIDHDSDADAPVYATEGDARKAMGERMAELGSTP